MRALNPVRCGFKLDPDTITNYIGRLDGSKIANLKTEDNALSVSLSVLSAHTHTHQAHTYVTTYPHDTAVHTRRAPGPARSRGCGGSACGCSGIANAIGPRPGRQWQRESRESGGRGSGDGVRYR